jgi:hypothetical protein
MVEKIIEKINSDDLWKTIVKNYEFIEGAQMSNSFIILLALSESKEPLSTTQISEKIGIKSWGQLFKVSGALKSVLTNSKLLLKFATLSVIKSLTSNPELYNFVIHDNSNNTTITYGSNYPLLMLSGREHQQNHLMIVILL